MLQHSTHCDCALGGPPYIAVLFSSKTPPATRYGLAPHPQAVPAHVSKAADKAREAAELRAGCEAAVAADQPADVAKLGAFLSYIKLEQNAGDADRVQVGAGVRG